MVNVSSKVIKIALYIPKCKQENDFLVLSFPVLII